MKPFAGGSIRKDLSLLLGHEMYWRVWDTM